MTDTDTSTEAVSTDAAPAEATAAEPKHRASKGALEAQVREVTDAYATGCLSEHPTDKPLTPLAIAKIVQARHGLDKMPSAGAVAANLDRWETIGFAVMSSGKPRAFVGYTPEAVSVGLSELKARSRVAKSDKRKAEKASAPAPEPTPAPAAEPVAAEPVEAPAHDIPVGTGL